MQGLGSGAITLAGSKAQRERWLPLVAQGAAIAAFALSEPDAGSDVGAMQMRALREPQGWRLDGCKTWISNGGIADFYCVFARTGEGSGAHGISAFIVPADAAGLTVSQRIELIARSNAMLGKLGFLTEATDRTIGQAAIAVARRRDR